MFKIMMKWLVMNTREAANHLISKLEDCKLTNVQGENVLKLTSVVGATVKRLGQMKDPQQRPYLPDDLNVKLLYVLQTTSVVDFNETFKFMKKSAKSSAQGADPVYPSVERILKTAKHDYQKLCNKGVWTGVMTSTDVGRPAHFLATQGEEEEEKCHNCLSPKHKLKDCRKPKDQARIGANMKKAAKARAQSKKTRHNHPFFWPTVNERANGSLRLIDGKIWKFNDTKKRWHELEGARVVLPDDQSEAGSGDSTGDQLLVFPYSFVLRDADLELTGLYDNY